MIADLYEVFPMGLAALAVILGVAAAAMIWLAGRRSSRRFPPSAAPRRLGAPHAGGNHALTRLGPPLPPRKS